MENLHGDIWIIRDEEEFLETCGIARKVIDYIESSENTEEVRWFFDMCYANWKNDKFDVLFKSWNTPGYENYLLSVEASKNKNGEWSIRTVKKIEG